jgi:hypothetical protein
MRPWDKIPQPNAKTWELELESGIMNFFSKGSIYTLLIWRAVAILPRDKLHQGASAAALLSS